VAYYLDGVNVTTNLVRGFRVDGSGNLLWGGTMKDISSVASGKGRLTGAFTSSGNSLLVWADNRMDGNGVYGQELNYNGDLGTVTSVHEVDVEVPDGFVLRQNYPNPFNPSTRIKFRIPGTSFISLKVFDLLGEEVASLISGELTSGEYEVQFDGRGLASGMYLYRLHAGEFVHTKSMMLIK